jgi:hypothetical protein
MTTISRLAIAFTLLCAWTAHGEEAKGSTGAPRGKPDWYGVWERVGSLNFDPTVPGNKPDQPPLTPEYQARFQKALDMAAAGTPINDPHANCVPLGFPRMMNMAYPFEILYGPDKITIISEESSQVRRIWMDSRKFPEPADLEQSYKGYSIGRWEGDELVVETRGLRGDMMLTQKGLEHTKNLRVMERWRQADPNTLKVDITLIDPIQFTRPWTVTKTYRRSKTYIMEYVCEENNRNPIRPDGVTGVILQSSK